MVKDQQLVSFIGKLALAKAIVKLVEESKEQAIITVAVQALRQVVLMVKDLQLVSFKQMYSIRLGQQGDSKGQKEEQS